MNAQRNDGGPAFPICGDSFNRGMTLRDWFASQALANRIICDADTGDVFRRNAEYAYRFADAMLAERAKGTS